MITRAAVVAISAALLALAAQGAAAQNKQVFRCEDANGRVVYGDEPCRGGVALKNTDERSAEQRSAAAETVRREEAMADKMARERRAAEKAHPPAGAARIPYSAAEKAASAPAKPAPDKTAKKKSKKKDKAPAQA